MTRAPLGDIEKEVLKKGPWTPDEDQKLVAYIQQHGHGSWRSLPINAGLQRCGKSCRLRWTNYLRPDIKRGRFSHEEDQMIVHLHAILGNRWSAIASHLPRRTDNEIKNYWNTHLKKRLMQMGIDPVTHKSTAAEELVHYSIIPGLRPVVSTNLTHMSQWDSARAEAEARLSRQSSLTSPASDLAQTSLEHQKSNLSTKNDVNNQVASSNFMSSWKAQVTETLRPNFGVVELDKPPASPVNLQKFLQEWESSLKAPQPEMEGPSIHDSITNIPSLSSGTASELVSTQYSPDVSSASYRMPVSSMILPSPAQISERLMASRHCDSLLPLPRIDLAGSNIFPAQSPSATESSFSFSGLCKVDNEHQYSPTSILHGPSGHDSSYSSPCGSSSSAYDSVDILAQSFSLVHNDNHQHSRATLAMNFSQEPSFWTQQQVALVDALQPESYFTHELGVNIAQKPPSHSFNLSVNSMVNQVGVPNNIPIPQFDYLC
ncbi:myb-related protein Pp1 [Physcomitrium patens]|uniref:Uncharacterized protein n=1 Tax=Physcomitrium patens TaxID=3218 RepID=A0A2K1JTM8_PHYPA|nr:myb-related protein Pp1-like [Physcomitrium patens]PNR44856.1 hypothetical protein PHYPA_014626 [Physcomitrium patens]|eukprot:XP_024388129.1 myb-related protein Pp1-like [Physcomitrella patens]